MELHKIIVPTDLSPDAEQALALAVELARPSQATIVLVHVCQPPGYACLDGGVLAPLPPMMISEAEEALDTLESECARLAADGIHVESACYQGDPATVIVWCAEAQNADLIVMGTHGRTGVRRLVRGSVAEHVVRRARQPVLTVHAPRPAHGAETIVAPV